MEDKIKTKKSKVWHIIAIIVISLLSLILLMNIVLIIKGTINKNRPPSIFNVTPLVVVSGSMDGVKSDSFDEGAIVFVKKAKTEELKTDDVIAFYDPASTKREIVTHRIMDIKNVDGQTLFYTKGDDNNTNDLYPVNSSEVIGLYSMHIDKLGYFALFVQEPVGMLIFIGVPVGIILLYEVFSKNKKSSKTQ